VVCKQVILEFQAKLVEKAEIQPRKKAALRCINLAQLAEIGP